MSDKVVPLRGTDLSHLKAAGDWQVGNRLLVRGNNSPAPVEIEVIDSAPGGFAKCRILAPEQPGSTWVAIGDFRVLHVWPRPTLQ